ncbi:MAG: SNF2 helicase associated domain-containing protein, partial [Bacteroidota bacterium]
KYLKINERYARGEELVLLKDNIPNLMPQDGQLAKLPYLPTHQFAEEFLNIQSKKKADKRSLFVYLFANPDIYHFYDLLTAVPFVANVKKDGTLHTNKIARYNDLQSHEQFAALDWQTVLIEHCDDTSSLNFSNKFDLSIKRLDSPISKQHYAALENLKTLKSLRDLLQEHEQQIYFTDISLFGRLHPTDLNGPFTLGFAHQISLELQQNGGLYELEPILSLRGERYRWSSPAIKRVHFLMFEVDETFYFFNSVHEAGLLKAYEDGSQPFAATETTFQAFMQAVVQPVSKLFEVEFTDLPSSYSHRYGDVAEPRKTVYFKELDGTIYITPTIYYDQFPVSLFDNGSTLQIDEEEIVEVLRNEPLEAEFKAFVMAAHPAFDEQWEDGFLYLTFDEFIDNYWFQDFAERCEAQGIEVYGFDEFEKLKYSPFKTKVMTNASSGVDWFDLQVSVTVGDEQVSLKEVRKAIVAQQQYVRLGSGKLALLPKEWVKRLSQYFRIGKVDKEGVRISKFQFNVLEEVFDELNELDIVKEIQQKKKRLREFDEIKTVALPAINATLRPYQTKGFEWLNFLHEYGWG